MTNASRRHSAVVILGIGRIVQVFTVFLAFRVLTSALSAGEVGFFFLLQSLVGFFGLIVVNPVGTFVSREIHGWEKSGSTRKNLSLFILFGCLSALAAGISTLFVGTLKVSSIGSHEPVFQTALAAIVMVAGATLANTFIPVLNILERRTAFVLLTATSQLLALGASYFVVTHYQPQASAWWITTGFVQIAFGFIAYWWIVMFRRTSAGEAHAVEPASTHPKNDVWKFAFPVAIANVAVWGLMQGYRPFVETFAGLDALATVGLGLGIAASVAAAFETLVMQIFLPHFYRDSHAADPKLREVNWNNLWQKSVPTYLALTCSLFILAPAFVKLLSGDNFPMAARYLAIGAIAELARMCGNILILNAQSERNLAPTRVPYWVGAAVALAGSALAVKFQNMEIVAWSLVLGQLLASGLLAIKLVSLHMLRIPLSVIGRFLAVPIAGALLVRAMNPIIGISLLGFIVGGLTIHFWAKEKLT